MTENRLKLYMNHPYPVLVRKLSEMDGGGWLAEIPGLLGCSSDGETAVEALSNVEEAKKRWVSTALKRGMEISRQRET